MTRISQLSKELGMTNADLIDVLRNRMGLADKKSHSSALSDDQVAEVKKILQSGGSSEAPKTIGKPPVKVTKKIMAPAAEAPVTSMPPKILVKKASPPVIEEASSLQVVETSEASLDHATPTPTIPTPVKSLPPRLVVPQAPKPQPHSTATVKLQTATNTSKGEVKHGGTPTGRPRYLPPRGEIGVYKPDTTSIIKISQGTPTNEPRKDLGRITLPTPRTPGSGRPGMGSGRPGGPGGRPGSRPGMGSGRPGSRPGMGSGRPGGPGGRPGINIPTGPVDPATLKGPGRSLSIGGRKKKKEIKEAEEMEL